MSSNRQSLIWIIGTNELQTQSQSETEFNVENLIKEIYRAKDGTEKKVLPFLMTKCCVASI
jgi:hypothetical protein